MVAKFEAQLTEIQQALDHATEETKNEQVVDNQMRHKEAKSFDKLSLQEKMDLVTFNARMSQARDLDILSSMVDNKSKLKGGKPHFRKYNKKGRNCDEQSCKFRTLTPNRLQKRSEEKI